MPSTSYDTSFSHLAHPRTVSMNLFGRSGRAIVEPIDLREVVETQRVPHGQPAFSVTDLDVEHINFASLDPAPVQTEPLPELAWAEIVVNESPGLFDFWVEIIATPPADHGVQEAKV